MRIRNPFASRSTNLPMTDLFRSSKRSKDWTFLGPVEACVCGSNLFQVLVWFEDGEVAGYFTDAMCVFCGARLIAPTLAD